MSARFGVHEHEGMAVWVVFLRGLQKGCRNARFRHIIPITAHRETRMCSVPFLFLFNSVVALWCFSRGIPVSF